MGNRSILGMLVCLSLVKFCFAETSRRPGPPARRAAPPRRVLFIGNSYTAQIKACLLRMLADSPYTNTTFEFITKGGATLAQHLRDENTLEHIKTGQWDIVVLQEQSQTPALPGRFAASFQASVEDFAGRIRRAGAEPVLFMTWGRRNGDPRNEKLLPDYETMQRKLSDAYRHAARRNKLALAPVGDAWATVRKQDAALGGALYKRDGSHPSAKGAILASCVFFRVLFKDSLEAIQHQGAVQEEEWPLIKSAALNTKSI